MTVTHAIFTQDLTHVLRDIELNAQTGLLRIEYVGERNVETGEIFFEDGNTIFAQAEQEAGERALLRIMSWDKVYYSFMAHFPSSPIEEAAHRGVHAVFRVLPRAAAHKVMYQLKRQDRAIFMLLNGRRTIRDVAQLVHRSELSVAHVLARLLKSGYIECVQAQDNQGELNVARTLIRLLSSS